MGSNPPIKLFASDIDGTLVDGSRSVTRATASAVKRLREAGIEFLLASGRIPSSMEPFCKDLGIDSCPLIGANGAVMLDFDHNVLYETHLNPSVISVVSRYCQENNLHLNGYSATELYFQSHDRWSEFYLERAKYLTPIICEYPGFEALKLCKVLIVDDAIAQKEHFRYLSSALRELPAELTVSEPEYLEILPQGVSKGATLEAYSTSRGIKSSEVAAIGDYYNDREMIRFAGYSIAMGNSPADLKADARFVTDSNENDGFSNAVDHLLTGYT